MKSTLDLLPEGGSAVVERLLGTGAIRRRLCDLGLTAGAAVTCLKVGPGGSIAAYLIRGAVIAIRKEDAEKITLRKSRTEARSHSLA